MRPYRQNNVQEFIEFEEFLDSVADTIYLYVTHLKVSKPTREITSVHSVSGRDTTHPTINSEIVP